MIREGEDPPEYDVVIVGSGPAGATIASELQGSGLRVAVLESGGRKTTARGDALRQVESDGIRIKDYSRERVLGGASTTWAGLSSPFDAIDFEARPFVPDSGWPIARGDLIPYWEQAAARYRFPALSHFAPGGFDAIRAGGALEPRWSALEEKVFLACAEPQDFGRELRHVYEREGVDLWLDATVIALEARPGSRAIAAARVRDASGRERLFRARFFVVAAGGIENARLLLASTDLCAAGLGNERDQVGRRFMNHPKNYAGILTLRRPVESLPYFFGCLHAGFAGYGGLRLRESEQRARGLLNSYVRFEPLFPWSDDRGVESLVLLVKRTRFLLAGLKKKSRGQVVELRDYSETGDDSDLQNERKGAGGWAMVVLSILLHLPRVAQYLFFRLVPGVRPRIRRVRLRNFMEMQPDPANRVTLGEARDADGRRVARVVHRCSELDQRSLVALHSALREELAREGVGELATDLDHADPWPIDQDASHHLGATRMGDDPATSVVDRDLKVHGVANVFAAGASVFPTSGCANPTFTIVALSIRLAEHLRRLAGADLTDAAGGMSTRDVLVVGAGKRVVEVALPAMLATDEIRVRGVFARTARPLEVGAERFEVRPLDSLTQAEVAACRWIYLAVNKEAVPKVLRKLTALDVSKVELLIDTPPLTPMQFANLPLFERFRKVWVMEDCCELPAFAVAREAAERHGFGRLVEVEFHRSAYRYHALATLKTLFGAPLRSGRRRRAGKGDEWRLLRLGRGRARVLEPRDYASGFTRLAFERGVITDEPGAAAPLIRLECIVEDGRCVGFRAGGVERRLAPAEAALMRNIDAGASLTARMEDMKRVGFLRLLRRLIDGRGGYPLAEGLDDSLADFVLEKAGRWIATPLLTVRTRFGRRAFASAMKLLRRRA